MPTIVWVLLAFVVAIGLLYKRKGLVPFAVAFAAIAIASLIFKANAGVTCVAAVVAIITALASIASLRQNLVTRTIFGIYKKIMPNMSDTEKTALDAGTVGWDGQLFAGKPDWQRLFDIPKPELSAEEKSFMENESIKLAEMVDPWNIDHERADLPPEIWEHLRKTKVFGMIIPKDEGGLGFSAQAQSAVLQMSTANSSLMSTIGVPNSLGPGELIHKYGTDEQKEYYLPRLADGREIPCFALTGPRAGSDATSLPDTGIVCKGKYEGKEVIGIKLNFNKRWITLAPVATVIGLAFRMFDPEGLMGDKEDIGITCALLPRNTKNVTIGRRHAPTGSPFLNGPIQGKDVFIPLEFIIGGQDMAGQGWRMLVECLSVGRCITLPSSGAGGAKYAAATSGAYARIRRQFNVSVSQLEGVQEVLARITSNCYIATAAVENTCAMVDMGEVPSVPSAILKQQLTEIARKVSNDAMDVHAGRAVVTGPRNYIARGYQSVPVAITVEGANILTRSMIIFGQGAIRCHPYVLGEMDAAKADDLEGFDKALFGHIGFVFSNAARSLVMGLTGAKFTTSPKSGAVAKYYKQVNRYTAAFALMVDSCMFSLGGALKFREMISGRLADMVSNMYLMTMVLKHWENQGRQSEDFPMVEYCCQELSARYEKALDELLKNLPARPLAWVLRRVVLPYGVTAKGPNDKLTTKLSDIITNDTDARKRLISGTYQGEKMGGGTNPVWAYNNLLAEADRAKPLYKKVAEAVKKDIVAPDLLHIEERIKVCGEKGILTKEETEFMLDFEKRVLEMLQVDDFEFEELGTKAEPRHKTHPHLKA